MLTKRLSIRKIRTLVLIFFFISVIVLVSISLIDSKNINKSNKIIELGKENTKNVVNNEGENNLNKIKDKINDNTEKTTEKNNEGIEEEDILKQNKGEGIEEENILKQNNEKEIEDMLPNQVNEAEIENGDILPNPDNEELDGDILPNPDNEELDGDILQNQDNDEGMEDENNMKQNKTNITQDIGNENKTIGQEEEKEKKVYKLYHQGHNYRDGDDPTGAECPIAWKWVNKQDESDIIVLNVLDNYGTINSIERFNYDKERQKILAMSMESTSNYNSMLTKKKYFDYVIDYRLDSDVPIPYSYSFFDFSKKPIETSRKGKNGRGLAAVFISNCNARNKRKEYLVELMKHTRIDSFGSCENNKKIYDEDYALSGWDIKMNTIKKYKFTLAFENSDDRDYVTEKFFQPLEVGSVPVFFGTTNIYDFAPPNSYISANDFNSAKELAEYLEFLDKNDDEYEKYLEWKHTGEFGDNLKHLIEIRKLNSICQLLQRINNLWINPYLKEWKRPEVPESEYACRLC